MVIGIFWGEEQPMSGKEIEYLKSISEEGNLDTFISSPFDIIHDYIFVRLAQHLTNSLDKFIRTIIISEENFEYNCLQDGADKEEFGLRLHEFKALYGHFCDKYGYEKLDIEKHINVLKRFQLQIQVNKDSKSFA